MIPRESLNWPLPATTVNPSGKRGVTSISMKCWNSASVTVDPSRFERPSKSSVRLKCFPVDDAPQRSRMLRLSGVAQRRSDSRARTHTRTTARTARSREGCGSMFLLIHDGQSVRHTPQSEDLIHAVDGGQCAPSWSRREGNIAEVERDAPTLSIDPSAVVPAKVSPAWGKRARVWFLAWPATKPSARADAAGAR